MHLATILYKVGGMKHDDRVLTFILARILVSMGSNHAQLNIEDIFLIHAFKERIQVD